MSRLASGPLVNSLTCRRRQLLHKAATATVQFSDVLVNLDEVEAKPQTEAAGLTFTFDNAADVEPRFWLGVALDRLDDTLRLHLGIAPGTGLIVTGVENESPAAKAGRQQVGL